MLISDLIRQLQEIESEAGDIPVRFIGTLPEDADEDTIDVAGVAVLEDANGVPMQATICDDLTLDGFSDGDYDSG